MTWRLGLPSTKRCAGDKGASNRGSGRGKTDGEACDLVGVKDGVHGTLLCPSSMGLYFYIPFLRSQRQPSLNRLSLSQVSLHVLALPCIKSTSPLHRPEPPCRAPLASSAFPWSPATLVDLEKHSAPPTMTPPSQPNSSSSDY